MTVTHPNRSLPKLRKLLGPNFRYRLNPDAPDEEGRREAADQLAAVRAEKEACAKRRDERRSALLQGDAEYQRLIAEAKDVGDRHAKLAGLSRAFKITAGTVDGGGPFSFFHVRAEGDNWTEVVEKLEQRKR